MIPDIESAMREALDGKFITVHYHTGEVIERRVSKNYMPPYAVDVSGIRKATGSANGKFKPFTPELDDMIVACRDKMMSWDQIAAAVGRSAGNVRPRYFDLCKWRGLSPVRQIKKVLP